MTPNPEASRLAEERQRFEEYIRKDRGDLTTFGRGANMHYLNGYVNNAWLGWLERSKQDAAPTSAAVVVHESPNVSDNAACLSRVSHNVPTSASTVPEWLPIETAPKDGTAVILGYISGHSAIAGHSEEGYWMDDASRNHWGRTGWYATSDDVLCDDPSHPDVWMPLPTPPGACSVTDGEAKK